MFIKQFKILVNGIKYLCIFIVTDFNFLQKIYQYKVPDKQQPYTT